VQGFPGSGSDDFRPPSSVFSRPALSTLYGPSGDSRLAVTKLDDLWTRSNVQLAQFVQSGVEGRVPRPEITGTDLYALLYFLRMNMLDGKLVPGVDIGRIKTDLTQAGLLNESDTRQSEIREAASRAVSASSVEISWKTDEPTLGVLFYGLTDYYGLTSEIQSAHAKTHALTLTGLVNNKVYHFQIRSKDLQGNQTVTRDFTFTLGAPPAVLCGDFNGDGQVNLRDVTHGVDGLLGKVAVPGSSDPRFRVWDLNRNGTFDLGDLLRIVHHLLGKPDQFPPEGCS